MSIVQLIDLGMQPVTNRFLTNSKEKSPKFPLSISVCTDTGVISLDKPFPVKEVKPRFNWLTCFEPEDHLDNLVDKLVQLPGISDKSCIGGYSFKDDSTLKRIEKLGYKKIWRIDPKNDLNIDDRAASVETYQSHFTGSKANRIAEKYGLSDIFIVRHVVEHAYNLSEFIKSVRKLVKLNGYIVWELPDCEKGLNSGDCTIIWEEHTYYFTKLTFEKLLKKEGFYIADYYTVPYPLEDSIVAIVKESHTDSKYSDNEKYIEGEVVRALNFSNILSIRRKIVREKLIKITNKYGKIALFGAGHLAVTYISIMGISDLIRYVIDDNVNKKGKIMPIGMLDIVGSSALYKDDVVVCLLTLNPQNHNSVINSNYKFLNKGGMFLSIFPNSSNYLENVL
jgi:hypothetical protein